MSSVTYWNRLIPQPTGSSLEPGLAARVRDPLWTLARQLQLGEFLGVDGGSPGFIDIASRTAFFQRANAPLEPALEAEAATPDGSLRVEVGQVLEGMIDAALTPAAKATAAKAALRTQFPLPSAQSAASDGVLAACAGRVVDGVAVSLALSRGQPPVLDPATDAALGPVYARFSAWVAEVVGTIGTGPPANWSASTLKYSLSLQTTLPDGRAATLAAEPDRSGDLEWYAFDLAEAQSPGAATPLVSQSLIPTHVRFRGMPNARFWDFESNKTEYGNVVADVPDAGRLLFLDFMLIQGVGWYVAPLDVPVGALCQVDSVTVHDVFGGSTVVPRADATLGPEGSRFTLFSTTDRTSGGVAPFLFAAPSCSAATLTSEPLEDVRLFRDDAAELAWAVEDVAPDADGVPTQGYERGQPPPPPSPLAILRYQLETQVPPAWFALLPQASAGTLVDFSLAAISPTGLQPWGRVVPSLATAPLPEQAIPRAGLRLQRVYCRSRWLDGSTYLWAALRRLLGSRGPSSGLVYDRVLPAGE
jgi:hypothetical protein